MKLLTKEIKQAMPKLYAMDGKPKDQVKIQVKYYTPWSNWTWWATEANAYLKNGKEVALKDAPEDEIEDIKFFGVVEGFEKELGYWMLSDLESLGPKIERDLYYKGTLADVLEVSQP